MMPVTVSKKEILAKLHQLPSLPLIVQEVIASFRNANLDSTVLAHKIAQDQGLSARVLRVANSSFYGLAREVGSMQEAVTVLGFDTVRSLVVLAGATFAFPPSANTLFDRQTYWINSFRVATYTEALAQCLGGARQMSFTAGLFHDVGQLALSICIPEKFAGLLAQQKNSGLSLIELERAELEGVLAHELSHIGNYDMLLSTVAVVLVGFISLLSDWFLRSLWWGGFGKNDREGKGGAAGREAAADGHRPALDQPAGRCHQSDRLRPLPARARL